MSNLSHRLIVLFSLLLPVPSLGGEITLKNGDIIHGELDSINEKQVIWKSDIFGLVKIPKHEVHEFSSSATMPLVTREKETVTNCSLRMDGVVTGHCDGGEQTSLPLMTLIVAEPPKTFTGDIRFGFNRKDGNTDTEDLDFIVNTQWLHDKFRQEVDLSAESEKTDGNVVDEHYETNYQLNYDFTERWFSYGRLGYTKDRFSAIDEQYQLGGGLGRRIILGNQMKLNLQLGAAVLVSHYNESGSETDLAGRWGMRMDWPIPGTDMTVFHENELLWAMSDVNNNQAESSTGIKIPLLGNLFSEFRYDFDYVNQPSDGHKRADEE
ncbi:DUF481 domain-containing protein [Porticoccus sp.]|uniref:DUF481 domain-containing protein n=1 Tax=Porticoccus sp. TaxID=2024853 RepID=UPI003F6A2360